MAMFNTLNQQQQPYIQSGYGAMSRLNTLLGIGGGGSAPASAPGAAYAPNGSGGMDQRIPSPVAQGPAAQGAQGMQGDMPQNMRLKQILALRAKNGDSEAARVLQSI
jgi:hypothetical protein